MAFIYKIINDINQKVYIGKTEQTVENVLKNIVRIINENDVRNVHCILP